MRVAITTYQDNFPGGIVGRIKATDQDPYDTLSYGFVTSRGTDGIYENLFEINPHDGTIIAFSGLDDGTYLLNVSVTDEKFVSYSQVAVEVELVTDEMLSNAVRVRIGPVTPEDFVLNYKKRFIRGMKAALGVQPKDILIVSIQTAEDERPKRSPSTMLDILFIVKKTSQTFLPRDTVRKELHAELDKLESALGLRVFRIEKDECTKDLCIHGKCADEMILEEGKVMVVTTDVEAYVAPRHHHKTMCHCKNGYTGESI